MPVSHPPDNAEWGGWISQHYVPKEGGAADGIWDSLVYSWHWMRSPLAAHSKPGAEPWGISQTESGRGANQIQHGRSKRKTRKPRGQVFWEARDPKQNKTKQNADGLELCQWLRTWQFQKILTGMGSRKNEMWRSTDSKCKLLSPGVWLSSRAEKQCPSRRGL